MNITILLIIVAALVVLGILIMGVFTMARGKDVTGKTSNKLMQARVLAQGATILLIILLLFVFAGGD